MRKITATFTRRLAGLTLLASGLILTAHSEAAAILFAGFESTDTWSNVAVSGGTVSTNTGAGEFPALQRIEEGTHSFQTNNAAGTVNFDPVDISNYDSVQITVRVSSTSATSGNGSDAPDFVKLFVALNGASFNSAADLVLNGLANARWGFDATLNAQTTAGTPMTVAAPQSGTSLNNYSTLTINIPDAATSFDFRITTLNDNVGEFWNIDAISVTGVAVPEPSAAIALVGGLGMLCGFRRLRTAGRRRVA